MYIYISFQIFCKKLVKTWCFFTIFHTEFDLVEDEFVLEIVHFKNLLIWFCLVSLPKSNFLTTNRALSHFFT